MKKRLAAERADEGRRITEGKEPTSVIYKIIARETLLSTRKNGIFAHLMHVTSWNLACRIGNTESIGLGHLKAVDDALQVFFNNTKTDKEGNLAKYPRHCYANPLQPEVCFVTALGLYFVLHPKTEEDVKLFGGASQYNHFLTELNHLLANNPAVMAQLVEEGLSPSDIGSHSNRKGAGTYCSGCNVECPSHVSVCIRCGWKLDGVQGTYLQFAAAGDQHVGRTLVLLPSFRPEFAILPPFFRSDDPVIDQALDVVFFGFPSNLRGVLRFCLASLVYHVDWLRETLSSEHRLFSSRLFADLALLERLKPLVECRLWKAGDPFLPTGVTNSVMMMGQMARVEQVGRETNQLLANLPTNIAETVAAECSQLVAAQATENGQLTAGGLERILEERLPQFLERVVPGIQALGGGDAANLAPAAAAPYEWNARPQLFPANFELPKGTTETVWMEWYFGRSVRGYPALRSATPADFRMPSTRKRFSDLKFLCQSIEALLRQNDLLVVNPTILQVQSMYQTVVPLLGLDWLSPKGRERRLSELEWSSVALYLRRNGVNPSLDVTAPRDARPRPAPRQLTLRQSTRPKKKRAVVPIDSSDEEAGEEEEDVGGDGDFDPAEIARATHESIRHRRGRVRIKGG
jgi:hypothetical protein